MDKRGKHTPGNKTEEATMNQVKEQIESFPKYRSHYTRQDNPNQQYLSPELSIAKMYAMYHASTAEKHMSKWMYRKVFNESFNLSFGRYVKNTLM